MPISLESVRANPELLLGVPEDQWFDRKSAEISARDLARSIVAFANAEGGLIAVGVSREGRLGGLKAHPERANQLRQAAFDFTEPPVPLKIHIVPCANKHGQPDELLVLEIEPSDQVHFLSDGKLFLRVGDENRSLNSEQATQLRYDKGISHFDHEVLSDASLADLDQSRIDSYRTRLGTNQEIEHVLAARGLYRNLGSRQGVTWAGLLLFGSQPDYFHPNAYVRLVQYDGDSPLTGTQLNIVRDERMGGRFRSSSSWSEIDYRNCLVT